MDSIQGADQGLGDEFIEQMLSIRGYSSSGGSKAGFVGGSSDGSSNLLGDGSGLGGGINVGLSGYRAGMGLGLPLGLNLDHGCSSSSVADDGGGGGGGVGGVGGGGDGDGSGNAASSPSRMIESNSMHLTNLFPTFGQMQFQPIQPSPQSIQVHQTFHGQPAPAPAPAASPPPAVGPRMRARRGQATDPHSIAERLRRERIAERMKALQELVPSCNKTDRAAMLDEIIDYVKFLRLQVKVLSMSRLGGAGAVAQLVADLPPSYIVEGEGTEGGQRAWEKWWNDGTEEQVAKLMEQDIGAAMQFLQSRALCLMPISLASAIFQSHSPLPPDPPAIVKPELNPPP